MEAGAGSPGSEGGDDDDPGTVVPQARGCYRRNGSSGEPVCSVHLGIFYLIIFLFFLRARLGVGLEETFCMSYLVDWILIFHALAVTTLA